MNLLQIFDGDYDKIASSVQPVLTKVKPKEAEFDLKYKKEILMEIMEIELCEK